MGWVGVREGGEYDPTPVALYYLHLYVPDTPDLYGPTNRNTC